MECTHRTLETVLAYHFINEERFIEMAKSTVGEISGGGDSTCCRCGLINDAFKLLLDSSCGSTFAKDIIKLFFEVGVGGCGVSNGGRAETDRVIDRLKR